MMDGFGALCSEVIEAGLCTDCGTCVAVCPAGAITMNYQTEQPELVGRCSRRCQLCYDTCPGKEVDLPELNRVAFGREPRAEEGLSGVAQGFFKGYAVDTRVRDGGTSGGVVSALLIYALEDNIVDGVVVTGMSARQPWRVEPKVATSREEVLANARSHYAVAPTNSILSEAMAAGLGRLGMVGLPCHLRGLRKVQALGRPRRLNNAVKFGIGLLCGLNFSYRGTEHIIQELCGVPLAQVAKMEYRPIEYPNNYRVTDKDGRIFVVTPEQRMKVSGRFHFDRCLMCDEYSNEVSDVSVGHYMPSGVKTDAGWSVIIVRSDRGRKLLEAAQAAHYLHVEPPDKEYLLGIGVERKRHRVVNEFLERQKNGRPTPAITGRPGAAAGSSGQSNRGSLTAAHSGSRVEKSAALAEYVDMLDWALGTIDSLLLDFGKATPLPEATTYHSLTVERLLKEQAGLRDMLAYHSSVLRYGSGDADLLDKGNKQLSEAGEVDLRILRELQNVFTA